MERLLHAILGLSKVLHQQYNTGVGVVGLALAPLWPTPGSSSAYNHTNFCSIIRIILIMIPVEQFIPH